VGNAVERLEAREMQDDPLFDQFHSTLPAGQMAGMLLRSGCWPADRGKKAAMVSKPSC
jgi:hypothetical protein